jgi:hypothetical protein
MPLVVLVEEDFSNLEINFPLYIVFASLLWDMEDMYGTSKGPRRYLKAVGTIELDDFI